MDPARDERRSRTSKPSRIDRAPASAPAGRRRVSNPELRISSLSFSNRKSPVPHRPKEPHSGSEAPSVGNSSGQTPPGEGKLAGSAADVAALPGGAAHVAEEPGDETRAMSQEDLSGGSKSRAPGSDGTDSRPPFSRSGPSGQPRSGGSWTGSSSHPGRRSPSWSAGQINPRPPELHEHVGPFELEDFLGRGGMGQVYRARDTRLDRTIALKLLLPGPPAFEQRFQREARAQARIDHESVCKVYEVGAADGRPFIAMQYLEGSTLSEVAGELTLEEKVSVMHQVAEGIHAAHRLALVHRDLKPSNIMVHRTEDGSPKAWVLDFGMVREAGDPQLTMTGEVVGTPYYMAPEQLDGDPAAIDRRTDIYGLGAVFYDILTGQPPIAGSNILDVLSRIAEEEPAPPRELVPDLPEDLAWIVLRCLEKEPGRRYRSAWELIRDLERYRQGEPVRARRSTWRYRWVKRVRKYQRLVAVGLIGTLVLIAFGWREVDRRQRAQKEARLASQFSSQIETLEWRLRLISTLPLHDTRPEREAVRQELEQLEQEVVEAGELAAGNGLLALGRGYRALGMSQKGFRYLRRAWDTGLRDPLLDYHLGLAFGEEYEDRLRRNPLEPDPEVRLRSRREAEARFKVPAVEHLQRARQRGQSTALAAAQLAIYEQRWNAALAALDEVEALHPWMYQARAMRAEVWHRRAIDLVSEGEKEEAELLIDRAREALLRATRQGESDPDMYIQLCDLEETRLVYFDRSLAHDPRKRQQMLSPCMHAIEADSASARALLFAAYTAESLSEALLFSGEPTALGYMQQARDWAERAHRLDLELRPALATLASTTMRLGEFGTTREDQERYLPAALEWAELARRLDPDDLTAALVVSEAAASMAAHLNTVGGDAESFLRRAVEVAEPVLDARLSALSVNEHMAWVESIHGEWLLGRGGDVDAALARAEAHLARAGEGQHTAESWPKLGLCLLRLRAELARAEPPASLDRCRAELQTELDLDPTNLEWHAADLALTRMEVLAGQREAGEARQTIEPILERLDAAEPYATHTVPSEIGLWRLMEARSAPTDRRAELLREAIASLDLSAGTTASLDDQISAAEARLMLAETERRSGRMEPARQWLQEALDRLDDAAARDARRIRLRLLRSVAQQIVERLELVGPPQQLADLADRARGLDFVGEAGEGNGLLDVASDGLLDGAGDGLGPGVTGPQADRPSAGPVLPHPDARWDALAKEPFLRADVHWWRSFLDQQPALTMT